ncbi:hypothetical protein [Leclercia sp.]|uniref:hypothetical protein n=1 Tax=Leclercia sp. TaxID=1898428 RepID=UPI0028A10A53|nr:hypothetical protein [Leclercia sp.]
MLNTATDKQKQVQFLSGKVSASLKNLACRGGLSGIDEGEHRVGVRLLYAPVNKYIDIIKDQLQ